MKLKALVLALALAPLSVPGFAGAVHLTTDLSADFLQGTSAGQIIATFAVADQPLLWGFGWEVIPYHTGFGGSYQVSFSQDAVSAWWLDWYAPALFLSFHPLGARRSLDPYLEVGMGSAGRVLLSGTPAPAVNESLYLALFPFLAGGLSLNLDGLLVGAKVAYTPYKAQIPVTSIPVDPLGAFQVTFTAGVSLGW
ncbi:MAG: hypothetical protein ABSG21_09555 [Spirochaetia bacterium]|jgi:hypothetical protein